MNRSEVFTIIFFTSILMAGCNNSAKYNGDEMPPIELNNGQKWNVNSEMSPFILEAEKILLRHEGINYDELAKQLKRENKALIKSCNMSGKSHEELHKWLHPHMQLLEELDNVKSQEESEKIVEELKASFQTYHKYFQ